MSAIKQRVKMNKFFNHFISRPFYSIVIIFFLILTGLWSIYKMPIDYFPGLNYPLINVVTQYPGVSPNDMEILVTRPIENRLQGIRGVNRTSSITSMGISQVTVEFSNKYSITQARQLAAAALSQLSGQLPNDVKPVIDNLGSRMEQVIGFTFVNGSVSASDLRALIQYRIKPALLSTGDISKIDVFGGERKAYIVEPDLDKMRELNLSLSDIKTALKQNNVITSGRYIEKGYFDIPIRGDGRYQNIDDFNYVKVNSSSKNKSVFLKDIASIKEGGLPEHYIVRSSHLPAVILIVQKADGAGTIEVSRLIKKKLSELTSLLPPGTKVHKFYDQSEVLEESMNGIKNEMLFGSILAMLVIFVFLKRWTPTLIISLTIPLAFMFAVISMYLYGYSFNMITLAALTLSLGMVVDDSIIVLEIIEKYLEKGKEIKDGIIIGVKEIFAADLNGTLTTIIVFLPLLFIGGYLSGLITPFGVTIALTLLGSFIISITVIPALIYWKGNLKNKKNIKSKLVESVIAVNNHILDYSMKHKKSAALILISVFLVTAAALPILNKAGMLPEVDEGALLIEYVTRPGVSLNESKNIAEALINEINKIPDVDNIYLKIGSPEDTYYIEDVNRGEFMIKFKDKSQRTQTVDEIIAELKNKFSHFNGIVCLYHQPTQEKIDESFSGLPAFFGVSVAGDNLDTLASLAGKMEMVMQRTGDFANIINNSKYLTPQIRILPKRAKLAYFDLSASELFAEIAIAYRGSRVTSVVKNQSPISIFLRLPPKNRETISELEMLPIRTPAGKYVPLKKLADIYMKNVLPTITHLNGERELTLIAEPEGNLFSAVDNLSVKFGDGFFPNGYTYHIRGQYQTLIKTVKSFGLVILMAIILVYFILYVQFNSFWQPFVILLKIPLDFIGVFIALLITRESLNISVGLGLLTLVGVSVNNAIILIDKINRLRNEEGMQLNEALKEAVHLRTRPILMTGLTTIFGLLPAAIGMGIGSKIHQPFAITIIGGMITGIIFSLNIIPTLYASFDAKFSKTKS